MVAQITRQSLAGEWTVRQTGATPTDAPANAGLDGSLAAEVPGDVYHDLLRADEIPDPFVEDTELDVQWVGETDWTYETTIEVDDAIAHDEHRLVFEGLDTVAEVSFNGEVVGTSDNMHRRYEFDVGAALEAGENEIAVAFESPVEYAAERANAYPYEVRSIEFPVEQPHRNFIRKAQCHFGWDWGTCLPTMGIWRDAELLSFSEPRITDVAVGQDHDDGTVELDVDLRVEAPAAGEHDVTVAIDDAEIDAASTTTVSIDSGISEPTVSLTVEDPDLWWPAGHGDQPLYDLTVELSTPGGTTADAASERIGFREIELVREPDGDADEPGESFGFEVNGQPIYAKGANWIPTDGIPTRVDDADYERLLSDAVDANMNMIRVWGGGIYERDAFYETCDEQGLLVWQDFMFACALYPSDDEFLDTVAAEAEYQVRRLASHPSIALWCGNNENEEMLREWIGEDAEDYDTYSDDYDALYLDTLGPIAEQYDPDDRAFWPASPHSSSPDVLPNDNREGDVHFWDVWHSGKPFSAYLDAEPRFASEFGYQSFPSIETLSEVLDPADMNPTAPLMEHHQRNPGGNGRILQRMVDHFRVPFDMGDFVYLSQVQQGLAIETAIEHWRRIKPHCGGTIYWQLNDMWQVASWSSIEYGGRWKALQHMTRRFYAPVLVSIVPVDDDGDPIGRDEDPAAAQVWVTSDEPQALDGDVEIAAETFDGETIHAETVAADVGPQESAVVATLDPDALGEDDVDADLTDLLLRAEYTGPEESYVAHEVLNVYKQLDLPDVDLDVTVEGDEVTVAADAAALYVRLGPGELQGHFSDNFFHLAAGEERTVTFDRQDGEDGALDDALTLTHLRETY
ncbi:beta-mannosidase [Salinarchaeum laminariae]|uniref:beta-mannosidase n=1 Tax=Salinarchaeum laminariae TaxID=869888 RepID=UPI0020BDD3E9|nr:glycoside hydrolase family 2 protein [Salinarchaeum laminariae]